MNNTVANDRRWFLAFALAVGIVPIVYFHNGLVTEYYFSKTVWGNILIPLPVLAVLWHAWRTRTLEFPKTRLIVPLVVLCMWSLISLAWTTNPYKGWELIGKIGAGPFAFIGTIYLVRDTDRIRGMLYLALLTMTIVALYGFVQYFEVTYLPKDQYGDADPSTTIGLTNFVVEYMMPFLLAGPLLLIGERRRWVRTLLLFSVGVVYMYVIISRNRAGMLGWVSEVVVMSLLLAWMVLRGRVTTLRISPRIAVSAALIAVVGLSTVLGGTVVGRRVVERFTQLLEPAAVETQATGSMSALDTFLVRARRDASVRFRLETWYQCLKNMFPDNPWVGVGLANLEVEFPLYYTNFLEGMTVRNNTRVVRSHNEYVQALVDLGIIGFVLLAWLLVQAARTATEGFRRCRRPGDFWLWLAINAGFVGYGVEMFFAFPLQVPTSSIFFFVALGLSSSLTSALRERDGATVVQTVMLDTPLRRSVAGIVFVALVLMTLRMEAFAYNALVGEVRNKEARVYKRYERWDESYRLLSDAIDHYPHMEGYYYDRAVVQMQMQRLDPALADLRKTAELVPNYAMGRKQIGMLAAQMNEVELAIAEFSKTAEIYRSQRDELAELIARTALKGRRPDLAVRHLEAHMASGEASPKLDRYLVDAYVQMGNWKQAIPVFERLRAAGEWDAAVRLQYASALYVQEDLEAAQAVISELLFDASDRAEAHLLQGKILLKRGDIQAAKASFARTVALKPSLRGALLSDPDVRADAALLAWAKTL